VPSRGTEENDKSSVDGIVNCGATIFAAIFFNLSLSPVAMLTFLLAEPFPRVLNPMPSPHLIS